MAYYSAQWLRFGGSELLVGVAIASLYGIPAWLGLPIITFLDRKTTSPSRKMVYLSPLLGAVATYVGVNALGA